jgi:hypothetical protein
VLHIGVSLMVHRLVKLTSRYYGHGTVGLPGLVGI